MNKTWLISIFFISFFLLATLEKQRVNSFNQYFKADRVIKLERFQTIKKTLSPPDQELLELWESMLTGRTAPVAKWMKERYRLLGLNHLFTPSGFHLSAVLWPFMKLIQGRSGQLFLLCLIGSLLLLLPGQGALKRMVVVKTHQKLIGTHIGFICAILVDMLIGTFQDSALSFSYSFLFLGIIYSGAQGLGLCFWFFIGQVLTAYFQNTALSPLLLILSPIVNLGFGLAMPFLLILACPLWSWQALIGIKILRVLQAIVDSSAMIIEHSPRLEVNVILIVMVILFSFKRWNYLLVTLVLFSCSLNLDLSKSPTQNNYDFFPKKSVKRILDTTVFFEDGKCKMFLVRGIWWNKCSPLRRSTKKKTKKLSYLSTEPRKFSLRELNTLNYA